MDGFQENVGVGFELLAMSVMSLEESINQTENTRFDHEVL